MTNIYLYANEKRVWQAIASEDPQKKDVEFLVKEGSYPAELYYVRFDLNGSRVMEREYCQNREELLDTLNWIGEIGGIVSGIWEFDEDKKMSPNLQKIFEDGKERKMEMIFRIVLDERISSAEKKKEENNNIEEIDIKRDTER